MSSTTNIMVSNPILPGFNPDPSICRVGDDFYIATSTFEWYPGVQIHHSTDLKNWRLVGRPLNRPDLLDMRGNPDSCGVWAPCLTYADDMFYLLYTDVKRFDGNYKDTHNYLTTCPTIDGDWSEPTYLNSSGFDPSIYHADDGRKYIANMIWDHRSPAQFFGGIVLQEFDTQAKELIGKREIIYRGSPIGRTEGPHIYKRGEYFYLITAEGGTGYEHAVSLARSKDLWGPYEDDPQGPIVTADGFPEHGLQKAGHGDFIELENGDAYLVHLVGRPLAGTDRCILGRETAIELVRWNDDGWLRTVVQDSVDISPNQNLPMLDVPVPSALRESRGRETSCHYRFDGDSLPLDFQWLRTPLSERIFSMEAHPERLRLFGRESIGSWFEQSLVARRQQAFDCDVETKLSFVSDSFQAAAGLVLYYRTDKFYFLHLVYDEEQGMTINLMRCLADRDWMLDYPVAAVNVTEDQCQSGIAFRAQIRGAIVSFAYSLNGSDWLSIGDQFDISVLSDDCGFGANFTGNFVGMAAQDLTGRGTHADFHYFDYQER